MNVKLIGWNSEGISDATSLCTTPDYDIIRWWRSRFKGILQLEWLCVFHQVTEKIQLERESRQTLLFSLWQPEQTDLTPNSLIRAVEQSRWHQSSWFASFGLQTVFKTSVYPASQIRSGPVEQYDHQSLTQNMDDSETRVLRTAKRTGKPPINYSSHWLND